MQHLLKADVEGVLEHVSNLDRSNSKENLSETVTSLICQEVQRTGVGMNQPDFCRQTHDLLFRAWQQNLGIYDPYAKFHHRDGLTTDEYCELVDKLSLWNELAQTLYSLSPEHALDILHCLRVSRPDSKFPLQCLATYYTICCSFPSQDIVRELLQHPTLKQLEDMSSLDSASIASILKSMCTILVKLNAHSQESSKPNHFAYQDAAEQIPQIFSNIYEAFKNLSFPQSSRLSSRIKHMYRLFWTEFCRNPLSKLRIVENDLLQTFLKESEDWGHVSQFNNDVKQGSSLEHQLSFNIDVEESLDNLDIPISNAARKHLMAFVKIYRLIDNNCPVETMQINESVNVKIPRVMNKQNHGNLATIADTTVIQKYVHSCLQKIQHQSAGWISFLELVVDFQDLFWRFFVDDSHLHDLITKAIVTENLQWRFFKRLSHNVNLYQQSENFIDLQCIQCITGLLIAIFKAISNRHQRLVFRNQIVYSSYQEGFDYTDITYGSIEIWSRKLIMECTTELRITCNQIVEQPDIDSDSNLTYNSNDVLIDSLCWLSMVMPYAVLKRLVLGCIENKGQTSAVHLILQKLGDLCSLKAHSNEEPLLITVLNSQEVAESASSLHNRRNYTDLICQWTRVETAYTNKDQDNKDSNDKVCNRLIPLLDVVEYFECCLIPGLSEAVRMSSNVVALLPAYLQLLHLTLSPIMEPETHSSLPYTHEVQSKSDPNQNRTLNWLLHVNVIQLISDLCALLALRNKLEDTQQSHEMAILSFLRYTDWEACMSSLDSLLHMLLSDMNVKAPTDRLKRILDHDGAQESSTVLVDRYSGFDWSLQIKLYPLLERIVNYYHHFEKIYIRLPTGLLDFFGDMDSIVVSDVKDLRDKWTLLMLTCKTNIWIQDLMLKSLTSPEHFNTISLHPYDNVGFVTGIYHALLPAKTLSVLPEFKRLLSDFLGQVFNISPVPQSIKDYDYGSESLNTLVKLLKIEDLQILYSILYSKMLLQTYTSISNYQYGQASSSGGEDEHDNEAIYFVSSIMRVIQSLQLWSSINDDEVKDMDSQSFSDYLHSVMPELHNGNNVQEVNSEASEMDWNKASDFVENEFDAYLQATSNQGHNVANRSQSSTANNVQHTELLFPPESEYNLSKISLSVITLHILSQIKDQFQVKKLRESIWIFMLQIVEGLSSDPQRRRLVQAAGKAGKASIKNWKKKTGVKYIVRCRPLLNDDQYALVQQSLTLLQDQQESHIIGQKLDIFGNASSKLPRYYL